jgi:transposase
MKLLTNSSYEKIKSAYDKEKDGRLKQRLLIILKAFKIKSSYKIAEQTATSHTKVQRWINRFNKYGFEGLKDKSRSGKPSKLNKKQKNQLAHIIENPGEFRAGYNTIEIMDKIQKNFGTKYSLRHIYRLLEDLDYSLITPRPSHIKKDPIKGKEIVKKLKKNFRVWAKNGKSLLATNSA